MTEQIAAYVDQVSDDPMRAVELCGKLGIRYLAVSRLWSTDIASCSDEALSAFKKKCVESGVDVIAIESKTYGPKIPLIASYFKSPHVIYRSPITTDAVIESVQYNYVPLVYYSPGIVKDSSRVKYFYDPTLVGLNHFENAWGSIKQQVAAVSVNDYDARAGAKPFGVGQNQLKQWLPETVGKWNILKPNLGRRLGSLNTREEIFAANFSTYKSLIGGM